MSNTGFRPKNISVLLSRIIREDFPFPPESWAVVHHIIDHENEVQVEVEIRTRNKTSKFKRLYL